MKYLVLNLLILSAIGCTSVPPGYVGIRVNYYGTHRGVEDYPLKTGMVWFNPFTEGVEKFPTFMQQAQWTQETTDYSPGDESVSFNSIEGSSLNVDVQLAYQIKAENVPHIFVKLRKDAEYITHTYMRSKVRDSLNRHASTMKVTDIFGGKKEELLKAVKADLDTELSSEGFEIDMVSFISKFRVDPQVEQSINMTITATQRSIEAENKIKQSLAEAQQAIATAEGRAKAVEIEAKAKAEANRILTQSLSSELLQYEGLQKWDGKMPVYFGGGQLPLITKELK